jgi:hypothetical protein
MQNRRTNDFPELQIGYPERNDVRNPNHEMERIHVDIENMELRRMNATDLTREITGQNPVQK